MKEIRLNECEVRADEQEEGKMIIEGYPIVFDKEAYIEGWDGGFYEKVDRKAFDKADRGRHAVRPWLHLSLHGHQHRQDGSRPGRCLHPDHR